MISVNSERLRNPANPNPMGTKKGKKTKKAIKADRPEKSHKIRFFMALLLGAFILWGGGQIGAFRIVIDGVDNLWNNATKAMGIRLEKIVLVDYELVGDDGRILSESATELPKQEILEALGLDGYIRGSRSLMEFDPDILKEKLEALPWVQYVVIKRFLPDTIQIHIVPRTAFVMQKKGDDFVMLDSFGNELPIITEKGGEGLLHITGENSFDASLALINILAEEPKLLEKIDLAERVSGRRWNIYLNNGVIVKMPEENEITAWKKLASLEKSEHIFDYAVNVIDFRLKDKLVLKGDFKAEIPTQEGLSKENTGV